MGIEFRGSYYRRDISLGKRTIKDGEAVAIWNQYGQHRQVVGPRLEYLWFSTIRFLDRLTAGMNEYLHIVNINGSIEHRRGPCFIYENPVYHQKVTVKKAHVLKSTHEVIVVTRNIEDGASIERRIIRGPQVYFPAIGDTVSETVIDTSRRLHKFEDMPVIISEGVKGKLQLSLDFAITDVESMLDGTSSVANSLSQALTVDMTVYSNVNKGNSDSADIDMLKTFTSPETFPTLFNCGKKLGLSISKLVYGGFILDAAIVAKRDADVAEEVAVMRKQIAAAQALADVKTDIEKTKLLNQREQDKITLELAAAAMRVEKENELERAKLNGKMQILKAEQEYMQAESDFKIKLATEAEAAKIGHLRRLHEEKVRLLSEYKSLGVDLNKVLEAETRGTGVPSVSGAVQMMKSALDTLENTVDGRH